MFLFVCIQSVTPGPTQSIHLCAKTFFSHTHMCPSCRPFDRFFDNYITFSFNVAECIICRQIRVSQHCDPVMLALTCKGCPNTAAVRECVKQDEIPLTFWRAKRSYLPLTILKAGMWNESYVFLLLAV